MVFKKTGARFKSTQLLWLFLIFICAVFGLLWFLSAFQTQVIKEKTEDSTFLQVTNREFSLFLWQNPEWMRVNRKHTLEYLPQFSSDDDIRVVPDYADDYVSVPRDVLYRYHTWKRLLGNLLWPRPISCMEFKDFLKKNIEWTPAFWSKAPPGYGEFLKNLHKKEECDLQEASFDELPLQVRLAFQGWKNYFLEWSEIIAISPTISEMSTFLKHYPYYNRCYWRNLLKENLPHYLFPFYGCLSPKNQVEEKLKEDEMSNFLKVGYYNYLKSQLKILKSPD